MTKTHAFYSAELTRSKPLTREREIVLSQRIKQGDLAARDELIRANLRYVVHVARTFQNRGLSMADLISAGNVGIVVAAERFDAEKACKFISYAVWWIKSYIFRALAEETRVVRLPANRTRLINEVNAAQQRLEQQGIDAPDAEDVTAELGVPVYEVEDARLNSIAVVSLDAPLQHEEDSGTILNVLPDVGAAADSAAEDASDSALLGRALNRLNDREQMIVRLYYGMDGAEIHTLEQIGNQLEITRERVRQIKKGALDKLKSMGKSLDLRVLVDHY